MKLVFSIVIILVLGASFGQEGQKSQLSPQNPNKMVFPNCSDVVAENGVKLLKILVREHS